MVKRQLAKRHRNIYIADQQNHRIRKINASGVISTVAGNGTAGFSGDGGQAAIAQLDGPSAVCVDASGVLYIADSNNHRVRSVSAQGAIETFAGNGIKGFSGDGGAANSAQLNKPSGVFLQGANLLIADTDNHRIRKVVLGPQGQSVSPTPYAHNAALSSNISATFSEAMTAASATNFRVYGALSGLRAGSYSGQSTTVLTFNPTKDFKPGEEVEVVFRADASTGVRSKAGVSIDKSYVYRFRAAAATGLAH